MVRNQIKDSETIILLVLAATEQTVNSLGYKLAKEVDKDWSRTIGVFTKSDRIEKNDMQRIIDDM